CARTLMHSAEVVGSIGRGIAFCNPAVSRRMFSIPMALLRMGRIRQGAGDDQAPEIREITGGTLGVTAHHRRIVSGANRQLAPQSCLRLGRLSLPIRSCRPPPEGRLRL